MKILLIAAIVLSSVSCQLMQSGKAIECGVGVKNEGALVACAMEVVTEQKVFSYGGVTPGRSKVTIDGYFVRADKDYDPIEIKYGFGYDVRSVKTYSIDWVKPPQEVLNGPYPPKMIIYIYPGIEDKKPRIVWKRVDQISSSR